jgi:hypothetical protein
MENRLSAERNSLNNLIKTRNTLRKKFHDLKKVQMSTEKHLRQTFEPITSNLRKLSAAAAIKGERAKKVAIKDEKGGTKSERVERAPSAENDTDETDDLFVGAERRLSGSKPLKKMLAVRRKLDFDDDDDERGEEFSDDLQTYLHEITTNTVPTVFKLTPGLVKLMFLKELDVGAYTSNDLENYRKMLMHSRLDKSRKNKNKSHIVV